ncbi:DUF2920 family protein [Ferrimonas marina]|uniref:DUF2920 family protein n=1 Tax=Ferrimonas marina TaxID=299255 RepID=A0A1M5VT75_9GAMM|nr:DUF2920 family protein [Ferrimonas marina]SHH78194.1 Protein of unknown function [Ferrimonas marina]
MNVDTLSIASNGEFELSPEATQRHCEARVFNPKPGQALVVYLPGFGADLSDYPEVFCRKVAEQHGVTSMLVEYHCYRSRPAVGAQINAEPRDLAVLSAMIQAMGGRPAGRWDQDSSLLAQLCQQQRRAVTIPATLLPPNGDYQNFGVLAALDVINAVRTVLARYQLDAEDVVLVGSSYGGYLANLATKLAPGLCRAVLDNSSWAEPNLVYLVGKELGKAEFGMKLHELIHAQLCVKSPWTLTPGLPNSLTDSRLAIRGFAAEQIQQMAQQGGTVTEYVCIHASQDGIANTACKQKMVREMQAAGFKVTLQLVSEKEVDGSYIKSFTHGLGLSMLQFFQRHYPALRVKPRLTETAQPIRYVHGDQRYCFDLEAQPIKASVEQASVEGKAMMEMEPAHA